MLRTALRRTATSVSRWRAATSSLASVAGRRRPVSVASVRGVGGGPYVQLKARVAVPLNLMPLKVTMVEVEERVMNTVKSFDRFPEGKELTLDTHFTNDLGLDSLDHVEIIMLIEENFELEIEAAKAEKLMTPRALIDFICDDQDIFE